MKRKAPLIVILSCVVIIALVIIAVFAECIAPYHYENEDREKSYHPPTTIHWIDASGTFHLWPFVYDTKSYVNENHERVYVPITDKRYPIRFFKKGDMYRLWNIIPLDVHVFGVDEPARLYIWGADARGRDLFSRICMGARISLSIGIIGVFISLLFGVTIGAVSGYFGGMIDQIVMRVAELFLMLPGFYILLALRSALPSHLSSLEVYVLVTCIISLIGWAGLARVIRGMVLSLREREYVMAARVLGASHLRTIVRHIVPHTLSYLLVIISVSIPGYIVAESALSFLGLGIQEPFVSWGMLLSDALSIVHMSFYPWMLMPGVCICVVILCCMIIGDYLRDTYDPHLI